MSLSEELGFNRESDGKILGMQRKKSMGPASEKPTVESERGT